MNEHPSQKEVAEAYMTGWGWADQGEDKFGCPYRISIRKERILKGWWLAGWNDRDMGVATCGK